MQSNEEKFLNQKAFLKKATEQLWLLQAEAIMLDLNSADQVIDACHTQLTSIKIIHETIGEKQFKRVPHGEIPDTPIFHNSIYMS